MCVRGDSVQISEDGAVLAAVAQALPAPGHRDDREVVAAAAMRWADPASLITADTRSSERTRASRELVETGFAHSE